MSRKNPQRRKFIAPQAGDVAREPSARSNADFQVITAAQMRGTASTAEAAAKIAREQLKALRDVERAATAEGRSTSGESVRASDLIERDADAFRQAFLEHLLRVQDISYAGGSKSTERFLHAVADGIVVKAAPPVVAEAAATPTNAARPEIDYVKVLRSKRGSTDQFVAEVKFTVRTKDLAREDVKAFRVFRETKPESSGGSNNNRLSLIGVHDIMATPLRTSARSALPFEVLQRNLEAAGVPNFLTDILPTDAFTGLRVPQATSNTSGSFAASGNTRNRTANVTADELVRSVLGIVGSAGIDLSVARDMLSLRNVQLQNPSTIPITSLLETLGGRAEFVDAMGKMGLQHVRDARAVPTTENALQSFKNEFKEIAFVPVSRLRSRRVGSFTEFTYFDETVQYGRAYSYYVTSIDRETAESVRSRIVPASVEWLIPPKKPRVDMAVDRHVVSFSIFSDPDDHVEKYEIYRRGVITSGEDERRNKGKSILAVGGERGFVIEESNRAVVSNGFVQVGETLAARGRGGIFRDVGVPGKTYSYRVYAVDVYGNKSQDPTEIEVFLDERGTRVRDSRAPTVTTDVDLRTNFVEITISHKDPLIVGFFLSRRDLTLCEVGFHTPGMPSHQRLGNYIVGNYRTSEDNVMRSGDVWNGYVQNDGSVSKFLDTTARLDHLYQYQVVGVDRRGHRTPSGITSPIFVSRRARIERPVNFAAKSVASGSSVTIQLSWDDGNVEVTPRERLASRDALDDSSVRTLYQVERLRVGREKWEQFPLSEGRTFDDRTGNDVPPAFRPEFLVVDQTYQYRVAAVQSGGFYSAFTDPLAVIASAPVLPPSQFKLTTPDPKTEPFYVVVNWDILDGSGTVDKWIVERAAVNNFAASSVSDATTLAFEAVATVTREASRSTARALDDLGITKKRNRAARTLFTADRHFIDRDVRFGNTYFYRVTAVGMVDVNRASTSVRGLKIADGIFDLKLGEVTSQEEKNRAGKNNKALTVKGEFLR